MPSSAASPTPYVSKLLQVLQSNFPAERLARLVVRNLQSDANRPPEPLDLSVIADPRWLSRPELVRQILAPAFAEGWLTVRDPVVFARLLDRMADAQVRQWAEDVLRAHPWPPGLYIPSFAEWVESPKYLGAVKLTARQRHWFEDSIGGHAYDWFVRPRRYNLIVIAAGKGCKSGNTILKDYYSGETRTMREWAESGRPLLLPSWDGTGVVLRESSPVYRKGEATLFRVAFTDGRTEIVTGEHRYLTPHGWAELRTLSPGAAVLALPSLCASDAAYLPIRAIENWGHDEFYDLTVPGTECYFDAQGILAHNSGKDLFASWVDSYLPWTVHQMRNPWWHFHIPVGEPMDIVNVAQNQKQARRVFFTKLRRNLHRKCFAHILPKKSILADEVFFKKTMPGEDGPLDSLRLHSLNSQNEASEGLNTLAFTLDEFDAFRTKEGSETADLMLNTLQTSSRFRNLQLGIVISYARSLNGPLLRALGQCGNRNPDGNPEWWGDLAPAWEVLPWRTFIEVRHEGRRFWTNPIGEDLLRQGKVQEALAQGVLNEMPDSEMARLWRTNREKFNEVYGCKPPASIDAYIQQPEKIEEAVELGADACLEPIAEVVPFQSQYADARTGKLRKFVARRLEQIVMRPGVVYFIGGDAGETQDSFALCVAHLVPPHEKGQICPACWGNRQRRLTKHYVPEELPTRQDDPLFQPGEWPCDFCAAVPQPAAAPNPTLSGQFWGFARPSGRPIKRDVVIGHTRDGGEVYATERVPVKNPVTGEVEFQERVLQEEAYLPVVVEDLLVEWRPDKTQGLTVDFENVKEMILQLTRYGQVGAVRIDRWQATMMIQMLQKQGLDAQQETFGNAAQLGWYANHKHLLYTNQLMYQPERADNGAYRKARRELREVQLINNNRIDHPDESSEGERGSKDLTDAQGLAFWLCVEHEVARGIIETGKGVLAIAQMDRASESAARAEIGQGSVVGGVLREFGLLR